MRDIIVYLEDIKEAISRIEHSLSGKTKKDFLNDHDLQDVVARRLEIIGEATKQIPWKSISGTRDILIHAYFEIDLEKIWVVVKKDLPVLKKEIDKMLKIFREE